MKTKTALMPRQKRVAPKRTGRRSSSASSKSTGSHPVPTPPKRILVPVDFSLPANQALVYARAIARKFSARIILIHVVEAFPIDYLIGRKSAKAANAWLLEQARVRLQRLGGQLRSAGRAALESVVAFGKPFQEIARAAKEQDIDLIIIATRGLTGLQHVQLGSTVGRVVRHAPCPVLVVRAEPNSSEEHRPPPTGISLEAKQITQREPAGSEPAKAVPLPFQVQNILVPIDFSPRSGIALEYALTIARRFHAGIVLLHVVHADYHASSGDYSAFDYPELIEELRQAGEKQLGELARSVRKKCRVKTVIESGHPGNLIVETADRLGTELIIMATHGRTGFKRAFLGSTAEFVVRHARVPVLTLREQERRSN